LIQQAVYHSAHRRGLSDGVDEDADAVGHPVHRHRRAGGQDDDVGVGHVLEDDLLGLLRRQAHDLRPRRLLLAAGGVHGAHRRCRSARTDISVNNCRDRSIDGVYGMNYYSSSPRGIELTCLELMVIVCEFVMMTSSVDRVLDLRLGRWWCA
jgi:hypothetical protein